MRHVQTALGVSERRACPTLDQPRSIQRNLKSASARFGWRRDLVALLEPNQRGRRAFDRFLTDKGEPLGAADRAPAERMTGAWFSLFRLAGRHEVAGLWLMDESLKATAAEAMIVGMRPFDAVPFHAGFGIIVEPDAETVEFCLQAKARGGPPPFRHSLAATFYSDQLRATTPPGLADLALLATLFETLNSASDLETTQKGRTSLEFFTTIATLGTPQDVTPQELRIECFVP